MNSNKVKTLMLFALFFGILSANAQMEKNSKERKPKTKEEITTNANKLAVEIGLKGDEKTAFVNLQVDHRLKMQQLRKEHKDQMKSLLTPEQQKKLREIRRSNHGKGNPTYE